MGNSRMRTLGAAAATALTITLCAPVATASEVEADTVSVTVQASGMYDTSKEVNLSTIPTETFTITGPSDQIDDLLDARLKLTKTKFERQGSKLGVGSGLLKYDPVFGNCGMSWVELRGTGSYVQGQGALSAGWELSAAYVRRAMTYDSNVLFFSTSHLDGHTQNFGDYGVMNGLVRTWGTRVTIPKKQEYGATMNVGRVDIIRAADGKPGVCSTLGPRVDNVLLYK